MATSVTCSAPPKKIACGTYHTASISNQPEGFPQKVGTITEVYTWGRNQFNILATFDADKEKFSPAKVDKTVFGIKKTEGSGGNIQDSFHIYEVSMGVNHTMFLIKKKEDPGGRLFACGLGNAGRLGASNPENEGADDGTEVQDTWCSKTAAVPVSFPQHIDGAQVEILRVCCGADHTLCLDTRGQLWAWGMNSDGQCGIGTTTDVSKPVVVMEDVICTHFGAGPQHSLMCTSQGRMYTWGNGLNGRLGLGHNTSQIVPVVVEEGGCDNVVQVAAGEAHSGAIDTNGRLYCWGAGSYGRLGVGEPNDMPVPRRLESLADVAIRMVALGAFHGLAVCPKPPKVYSWGVGAATGVLPDGDNTLILTPRQIIDPKTVSTGGRISQIACGTFHSLILMESGELVSFGLGANGRLGHGKPKNSSYPQQMKSAHKGFASLWRFPDQDLQIVRFKFVDDAEKQTGAAASGGECAVVDDQGDGHKHEDKPKHPWLLQQLACGAANTCALTQGGHLYVWGSNNFGQLGTGNTTNTWQPGRVHVCGKLISKISVGYEFCLAITQHGDLYAWGAGSGGQLGNGKAKHEHSPKPVLVVSNVICCSAGEDHSAAICAVPHNGGNVLYTWGNCEMGRLGLGDGYIHGMMSTPKVVDIGGPFKEGQTLRGPLSVHCGQSHTAVRFSPDLLQKETDVMVELWTFGGGWNGKLGQKGQANLYWPKECKDLDFSSRSIALSSEHTCVITTSSDAKALGGDLWMMGAGGCCCEPDDVEIPKKFMHIDGEPKWSAVACGLRHTLATTEGGEVYCWGANNFGQLGLGKKAKDRCHMPEVVKSMPGSSELLATGPAHSIALLNNGEVFAWGCQSCGRLGLLEKQQTQVVHEPSKVKSEWSSIEAMSSVVAVGADAEGDADGDSDADEDEDADAAEAKKLANDAQQDQMTRMLTSIHEGQTVQQFHTMQTLLKKESEEAREGALKTRENELIKTLTGYIQEIYKLPELERQLEKLQGDLEQSFCGNLRHFKAAKPAEPGTTINARVAVKLTLFEQLLWVLQQQACYLAQLSMCLGGDDDEEIFYITVKRLYQELSDARTLHLFMAMLRLMIGKEIEHAKKIEEVFNDKSRVFVLFSHFALDAIHYKLVCHPVMNVNPDKGLPKTLLGAVHQATSRGEIFALDKKSYIASLSAEEQQRDSQEIASEFNSNLEKFKEFMSGDFTETLSRVNLHENLRKIFAHCLSEIRRRQFSASETRDRSITEELAICQPVLLLFIRGVLIKMLSDTKAYGGSQVLLAHCEKEVTEDMVVKNCQVLCTFLEAVTTDNGLEKLGSKLLQAIGKTLKPELLHYLVEQATWPDDTNTMLTVDVYITHFDRQKHFVTMPTSVLLKLSNMLKLNENKLRLTEHDAVEQICHKIGDWDPDVIKEAEKNEKLHNFVMNARFLFEDQNMTICRTSKCPVPPKLSASAVRGGDDEGPMVVDTYQPESADNPRRTLEELFRDLEPLESTDFNEMKTEFEELMKKYSSKTPPNYDMTHRLAAGLRKIDELRNIEAHTSDVLQFMADSLGARDRHRLYLSQVEVGATQIQKVKEQYYTDFNLAIRELKAATEFSTDLVLSTKLLAGCAAGGITPKMQTIALSMQKFSSFDRKAMPAGTSFTPTVTLPLSRLKKDKVVVEILDPLTSLQKGMQFTLSVTDDGGCEIAVASTVGKSMSVLKRLTITSEKLQDLKRAEAGEKTQLGEPPVLVCICSNLVNLITKLSTGA